MLHPISNYLYCLNLEKAKYWIVNKLFQHINKFWSINIESKLKLLNSTKFVSKITFDPHKNICDGILWNLVPNNII